MNDEHKIEQLLWKIDSWIFFSNNKISNQVILRDEEAEL